MGGFAGGKPELRGDGRTEALRSEIVLMNANLAMQGGVGENVVFKLKLLRVGCVLVEAGERECQIVLNTELNGLVEGELTDSGRGGYGLNAAGVRILSRIVGI